MISMNRERIDRLGHLSPFGVVAYKQEVEKHKVSNERNIVYTNNPVEFPDYMGTRINIIIGD